MTKPTPTLEDTIRALAARGEISNLTLSMNSSYTKWRACLTPCSVFGNSFAEDPDPVKALMLAMTTVKLRSRMVTDRELDAMEAKATPKIDQKMVEVEADAGIDALM